MPAPELERPVPKSEEAERAILSAILFDGELIYDVSAALHPQEFFYGKHRLVYLAMCRLAAAQTVIDPITVADELGRKGELEAIGGQAFLGEIIDGGVRTAHVSHYVRQVKGKALLRRLAALGNRMLTAAFDGELPPEEQLEAAERGILDLAEQGAEAKFSALEDVAQRRLDAVEELSRQERRVTGLATGLFDLDRLLTGLHKGQLIILAARPAMGKSALALCVAEGAALAGENEGAVVAFFSLEMSEDSLADRFLCSMARVDSQRYRQGYLNPEEWDSLRRARGKMAEMRVYLDDSGTETVGKIRAKCRRLRRERGRLDLVIIDYLQLMQADERTHSRQQEIGKISRGLKELAKELKVPILALSQLNRACEERPNHRPILSDLRESGDIEQDSDVVAFLYRDEVYNAQSEAGNTAEVIVAKQREGPIGTAKLAYLKEFTRFENQVF